MKIVPFKNDFDWWSLFHFGGGGVLYWMLSQLRWIRPDSGNPTVFGRLLVVFVVASLWEIVWDNLLNGKVPMSDSRGFSRMDVIFTTLGGVCVSLVLS
jgi:hypothetical protein